MLLDESPNKGCRGCAALPAPLIRELFLTLDSLAIDAIIHMDVRDLATILHLYLCERP